MTQAEPAVGPEYGLEPTMDRTLKIPPTGSRDLTPTTDYREGSEFGGVGGLTQPPPHKPTASERLRQVYAIDPADDGTRPDSVAAPELEGEF